MNSGHHRSVRSRVGALLSIASLLLVPTLARAWNNDVKVGTPNGVLEGSLSSDGTTISLMAARVSMSTARA